MRNRQIFVSTPCSLVLTMVLGNVTSPRSTQFALVSAEMCDFELNDEIIDQCHVDLPNVNTINFIIRKVESRTPYLTRD